MKDINEKMLELLPDDIRIAYQEGDIDLVKEKLKELEKYGKAEAVYCAASAYAIGLGQEQDMDKAIELYKKSAMKGYAPAMNSLGLAYMEGFGVKTD